MTENQIITLPPPEMPVLDLLAIARTTRKSLDRLVSFCNMRSSIQEVQVILTKVTTKIRHFIHLIDSSILAAQYGYQLASDAMIVCDPEETEWEADINIESLKLICIKGEEVAKEVADGFRDIKQEIYKIAASTKDNLAVVSVPPDVTHTETLKMPLRDIGTGLVENLNLISQFSNSVMAMASWWTFVKDDLEAESSALFPNTPGIVDASSVAKFAMWSDIKEGYQQYYDVISTVQSKYPEFLATSATAWKAVAVAIVRSPNVSTAEDIGRGGLVPGNDQLSRMSRASRIWSVFSSVRKSRKRRSTKKKNQNKDRVDEKDEEKEKLDGVDVGPNQANTEQSSHPRDRSTTTRSSSSSSSASSSSLYSSSSPAPQSTPISRVQSTTRNSVSNARPATPAPPKASRRPFFCCSTDIFEDTFEHLGQYVKKKTEKKVGH